ncbi:hypothetical protein [Enterovibrio norvegicus]|uniref:hypothetical protein n=1 Tax=Enterovibrio norvegicus TaxID=188144 RepID=UPI00352C52DC
MKPIKTKNDQKAALERIEQVQRFEDINDPITQPNAPDINAGECTNEKEALLVSLQAIESNIRKLPMFSPIEALSFLNVSCLDVDEAREIVVEQVSLHAMFAFTFDNDEEICIPVFQFDQKNHCVLPIIPALAKCLSPINDWGTANWFLSHDEDLGMTPMDAVVRPEKAQTLFDLAGLFLNTSTLSHLRNDE